MRWAVPVAACCALVATALFRYLELNGFPNDQFEHLAGAQQILMGGEWPSRDFVDPGMPLMYITSAAAQWMLGRTLFAEAILVAVAFGLAAAFTFIGAYHVSRSLVISLVATALCVAIFPRPYGYPKALLYSACPLVIWSWMGEPTLRRLLWPAVLVVVAFLFRHDHGVYLSLAVAASTVLMPAAGWRQVVARLATFFALVVLLLAPYFIYLQAYGGLANHARTGIEFNRREADRSQLHFNAIRSGPEARLFYGFHTLPLAVLMLVAFDCRRRQTADAAVVVPLAAMAIAVNIGFLRDPLPARLPDAIVPAMLAGAWLAGRAVRVSSPRFRLAGAVFVAALVVAGADSVFAIGSTGEKLGRTNLSLGIDRTPELLRLKTADLQARFSPTQVPDGRLLRLVPFLDYVERCTTSRHRLLVVGFAPEVFVYSHRMFAGGQTTFVEGYYQSEQHQRQVIDRMERQVVQFALILTDVKRASFPVLRDFVDAHFEPLVEIPVASDRTVRVLVNPGFPPIGPPDPVTGWPCYRS